MTQPSPEFIDALKDIVGPRGFVDDPAGHAAYVVDWRDVYHGDTPLVLRPAATAEVSRIMAACSEAGVAVVPQGGNTGMVGGSVPRPGAGEVVVSLARMNRIRDVDPVDYTLLAEAGCVLADVQAAAEAADRLFPLSLAAEGSCRIGGNLATNAGGNAVLRFGNARDLVLGLEVVLPNGDVWNGLRGLRKDNTGYDLKHLFLGSEGTLGIITAAVLKLFPRPARTCTALVAVPEPAAATALLADLRGASGDGVTSFEYMHRRCIDLVLELVEGNVDPFDERHQHYALIELSSGRDDDELRDVLESVLGNALEAGRVIDAVLASSDAQAATLWKLRESIPEANNKTGGCIRHDVSVPVSRVAYMLERAHALCESLHPGVRTTPFGHLGDGNIHYNLVGAPGEDPGAFLACKDVLTPAIHDLVDELGGSFSAEHGVGQLKRDDLDRYRDPVEIELMRAVKRAVDPRGIMNPGKVLPG